MLLLQISAMHSYILTSSNFILGKISQESQKRKCFFPFKSKNCGSKVLLSHIFVLQTRIVTYVKNQMKDSYMIGNCHPRTLEAANLEEFSTRIGKFKFVLWGHSKADWNMETVLNANIVTVQNVQ